MHFLCTSELDEISAVHSFVFWLCTSDLYVIFGVHFCIFGVHFKCKEITEHLLHLLHLSAIENSPMVACCGLSTPRYWDGAGICNKRGGGSTRDYMPRRERFHVKALHHRHVQAQLQGMLPSALYALCEFH